MNKQNEKCGTVQIPSRIVKHLIGKNGANIIKIKGQTGTRINISRDPDKNGQVAVVVKGNSQRSVREAITLIQEFQKQYDAEIADGTFRGCKVTEYVAPKSSKDSQHASLSSNMAPVDNKKSSEVVLNPPKNLKVLVEEVGKDMFKSIVTIPVNSVPHFFGKDGWRIKILRAETSTWIFPLHEEPHEHKHWNPVTDAAGRIEFVVMGKEERNVQRAVFKINGFKTGFKKGVLKGPPIPANKSDEDCKPCTFDISGLIEKPPKSNTKSVKNFNLDSYGCI